MLCKYGDTLFVRKGREQSQHRYTAQKTRELWRFVLAPKEIYKGVKGLKDLCDATKFDLTIKAATRNSILVHLSSHLKFLSSEIHVRRPKAQLSF